MTGRLLHEEVGGYESWCLHWNATEGNSLLVSTLVYLRECALTGTEHRQFTLEPLLRRLVEVWLRPRGHDACKRGNDLRARHALDLNLGEGRWHALTRCGGRRHFSRRLWRRSVVGGSWLRCFVDGSCGRWQACAGIR